jgi:GT2 family glycosyltransferase
VWIPWNIFLEAGPLDGKFFHSLADLDYGYRLGNLGIEILAIPGTIGICEKNFESTHTSRLNLLRSQFSPKKLSVRNLSKFYFRYARFDLAFIYLISTYLKVILRVIFK